MSDALIGQLIGAAIFVGVLSFDVWILSRWARK